MRAAVSEGYKLSVSSLGPRQHALGCLARPPAGLVESRSKAAQLRLAAELLTCQVLKPVVLHNARRHAVHVCGRRSHDDVPLWLLRQLHLT